MDTQMDHHNTRFLTMIHFHPVSRWQRIKRSFIALLLALFSGCTSVTQIGTLGPKSLPIFVIKDTDFFAANRMIVVINQDGNVGAATGGSVAGPGNLAVQVGSSAILASGIAYAAHTLKTVTVDGTVKRATVTIDGTVKLVP